MSTEKPPIQIEDGIPLPKSRGGFKGFAETADIYAAVCALKPAQSVLIDTARLHRGMMSNFKRTYGGRFAQRTYGSGPNAGKTRIWRME